MAGLFDWLKGTSSEQRVEETLKLLSEAGFRLLADDAKTGIIEENAAHGANVAEGILCALGGEQYDPASLETKPWLSNDVWHFDYEAIEDHGAYTSIVENCFRLAQGELKISDVTDYVDIEEGKAWISFVHNEQNKKINLKVDNDWADPLVFAAMNKILETDGSDFRFAQHDLGQDCLIICRKPSELLNLNTQFKLNFKVEG
jgi:hypothetical protein